jgi:predicted  nucleic acid-binding Zn-ribbon protein
VEDDMADATTAGTAKLDDATKQVKPKARKAATHLRAVTTEPIVETKEIAEDRLAALREQIADLAEQVEEYAEDRLEDARDLIANVADAGTALAARAGRQTLSTARAVRDDPLPLIVGLGVVAILTAMVVGNANRR